MPSVNSHCEICSRLASPKNPILTYTEVSRLAGRAGALSLCAECVVARETRAWPRNAESGRNLRRALTERYDPPERRYTYLEDRNQIHLLRLRHDWVDRHVEGADA